MFMLPAILSILLVGAAISTAQEKDCPKNQLWNGKNCVPCSGCPIGWGLKEPCTPKNDTECQKCWAGYDYSDTNGTEECILCDAKSNCPAGKANIIKKCTIFAPTKCDGCIKGYYLKKGLGCTQCRKCNDNEVEEKACTTEHDRTCVEKPPAAPTTPLVGNKLKEGWKKIPNSTSPFTYPQREVAFEEPTSFGGNQTLSKALKAEKPDILMPAGLIVGLTAVAIIVAFAMYKRYTKGINKQGPRAVGETVDALENGNLLFDSVPLRVFGQDQGLDRPLTTISLEDRRRIARDLNGKTHDGFFLWALIAEKLSLNDEIEALKQANNPADEMLTASSEKKGSTVRSFINALTAADLGHFAEKYRKMFSKTDEDHEDQCASSDTAENRV